MATLYWGGGTGSWSGSSATNWFTDVGRTIPSASAPTNVDDVIFDSASNATGYTVTMVTGAVCRDCTVSGPASGNVTITGAGNFSIFGNWTVAATGVVWSTTGTNTMAATTTGKTINTNGVSINTGQIDFNGVGGGWTCTSAFNSGAGNISVTNGSFDTGNQTFTCNFFSSNNSNVRSISFGSSTCTFAGGGSMAATTTTNLTFNAGTSTINVSNSNATLNIAATGLTFYNVSFTAVAPGTLTINGANTYNNLTFTSRNATGIANLVFNANQTINGTLTLGAANTAIRRLFLRSDITGTQRTFTLNGSLATLADVDFRDIATAGSVGTWTGTRLGNAGNVSGITTDVAKTVYWNLAGTQNWSATGWATTNNGVPAVNNFPLPQDTATFTEAGAAGTVTIDANWNIGSIQMADGVSNRSTGFTLATGTTTPTIYGSVTFFSNLTLSGTGSLTFAGQGVTQAITSATKTWTQPWTINAPTGTVQLLDNNTLGATLTTTLTAGTLDLSNGNRTLTTGLWSSTNTNPRSIVFGTGNITVTGNSNFVILMSDMTNFTYTGTPTWNSTYAGATGTRSIRFGGTAGATEANVMSVNITAGTDIISFGTNVKDLNYTGFNGTIQNNTVNVYGNLTISSGATVDAGTSPLSFLATSGTQTVVTNGKTLDFPITVNCPGSTVLLSDSLTAGLNRTFTLTAGIIDLNTNKVLTIGPFSSSNSNARSFAFGTSGKVIVGANTATVWQMSTATNFTYTGTSWVEFNYAGATGTRTFGMGTGTTEANALNIKISAGSDTITLGGSSYRDLDYTGFSGTTTNASLTLYGSLTASAGMTFSAGTAVTTFASTSSGKTITSNGKTLDFPITFNGVNGVWTCQDALTLGSTRAFTVTNGTVQLKDGVTSTVGAFATSGTNQKFLQSTTPGSLATLSQASGTVNMSYLTFRDISATGGATWNALLNCLNNQNNRGIYFSYQQGVPLPALPL